MIIFKHLAFIVIAYLLAAVVTGYVVDVSLLADSGAAADGARKDLLGYGLFISFFVTYFAAAPASATVALGEYFSIRHWWYYALAGSAIGFGLGSMFKPPEFFPWLGLGFGPISGLIYWAVAGRKAGLADHRSRLVVAGLFVALAIFLLGYAWTAWFGMRF
jgi:hypothetical protein